MSTQRVVIWLDGALETQVVESLNAQASKFTVVRRCADLVELESVVRARLGTAVICSGDAAGVDAAFVERLRQNNIFILLIYTHPLTAPSLGEDAICDRDASAIVQTLTAGIRRQILGAEGENSPILQTENASESDRFNQLVKGAVIAVWGTSGAPGRTTLAVNLARVLGHYGKEVTVVDADTRAPSVTVSLGLAIEASGLAAAAALRNRGELDPTVLEQLRQPLGNGVSVLSGLTRADRWRQLSSEALSQIFAQLRTLGQVVVDLSDGFSDDDPSQLTFIPSREDINLSVLREADVVIVVARADTVGLSRLNTVVMECAERHVKVNLIVLNQVRPEAMGTGSTSALHEAMGAITTEIPYVLLPQTGKVDTAILNATTVFDLDRRSEYVLGLEAILRATALADPPAPRASLPWKQRWKQRRRKCRLKDQPVHDGVENTQTGGTAVQWVASAVPPRHNPPPPPLRRRSHRHQNH